MLELGYLFSLVRVDSLDGSPEISHDGSLSLLVVGDPLEHVLEAGNILVGLELEQSSLEPGTAQTCNLEAQQPSHIIQQPSP